MKSDTAYAFYFDGIHAGEICYRSISIYCGPSGEYGRDRRKPHPVSIRSFERALYALGQQVKWIRSEKDFGDLWKVPCWRLIPLAYVDNCLDKLLEPRICVKSPIGLFWDVKLKKDRSRSTSRRTSKLRKQVLMRDDYRCVECGKSEEDGVVLTMDHIIPFSHGGETTEGNLVTLCETCNQGHGNEHHPHLFGLAGLHHGWDPNLLNPSLEFDEDQELSAIMLSQNIMVGCCNSGLFPFITRCCTDLDNDMNYRAASS